MTIDEDRCERFGVDPKLVASIARRISRAAVEARELGLEVFGGSGIGTLRAIRNDMGGVQTVVAHLDGTFDGGDGGDDY